MKVTCVQEFTALEKYTSNWERLALDRPFHSWQWLSSWWETLGPPYRLLVLLVLDADEQVCGIAPWCVETSLARGTVIRSLGSGKACSDYMGVLCEPSRGAAVAEAIAGWLDNPASRDQLADFRWDLLELDGVAKSDAVIRRLTECLESTNCRAAVAQAERCWALELPEQWDTYLGTISSDYRRKLRNLDRKYIATGRATWQLASSDAQREVFLQSLIRLHTKRRESIGSSGCFSHLGFDQFLQLASARLLDRGKLWLTQTEIDGEPAANSICLQVGDTVYLYQCGFDPKFVKCNPGWIQNIFNLRAAIEGGYKRFDFLRGDEPYKKHLGASPVDTYRLRIASSGVVARLRLNLWSSIGAALHSLPSS